LWSSSRLLVSILMAFIDPRVIHQPKVACPIQKRTYNLETGKSSSNPGLNVAVFDVKVFVALREPS